MRWLCQPMCGPVISAARATLNVDGIVVTAPYKARRWPIARM